MGIKTSANYTSNLNSPCYRNNNDNNSYTTTTTATTETMNLTAGTTTTTTTAIPLETTTTQGSTTITTGPQNNDTTTTTIVGGIVTDVDADIYSLENTLKDLEYSATDKEFVALIDVYSDESQYNNYLEIYQTMREEKLKEIEEKQKEYDAIQQEVSEYFRNEDTSTNYPDMQKYEEINKELQVLYSDLANIDLSISELNKSLEELKYDKIRCMDEYNEYIKNLDNLKATYANKDNLVGLFNAGKCDQLLVLEMINQGYLDENDFNSRELEKVRKFYNYLSKDEKNMYHFIYGKCGIDEGNNYLSSKEDKINKEIGLIKATKRIEEMNLDDPNALQYVANFLGVTIEGLGDGINTFFEGLDNVVNADGIISEEQYERMFYLQLLSEKSKVLSGVYQFSNSTGNMLPSILASVAVSIAATPAAGEIVGSVLMGTSAGGNAQEQALQMGSSRIRALLYGILIGASETTLEYFIGGIPGLSNGATKSFISQLRKEGREELIQEFIDAFLQTSLLGQDFDIVETAENGFQAYIMGALMGGMFTGISNGVDKLCTIDLVIDGEKYSVDSKDLIEYIEVTDDITIESILEYKNSEGLEILHAPKPDIEYTYTNSFGQQQKISAKKLASILESDSCIDTLSHCGCGMNKQGIVNALQKYFIENQSQLSVIEQSNYYKLIGNLSNGEIDISSFKLVNHNLDLVLNDAHVYADYIKKLKDKPSYMISEELKDVPNLINFLKNSNEIIPPDVLFRLTSLNNMYLQSTYNIIDQHEIQNIINKYGKNSPEYNNMKNLVKQYFPYYSDKNVYQYLRIIDTRGVCTYATVINEIVEVYSSNPAAFYKDFGFSLYKLDRNGNKVLNSEMLLIDLFSYINQYNTAVTGLDSNGNLIAVDDTGAPCLSNNLYKETKAIEAYLKSKNADLTYTSKRITDYYNTKEEINASIKLGLSKGDTYEINVIPGYRNSKRDHINIYRIDGSVYESINGGHSMKILGVTPSGWLIVDSHHSSEPMYLKWDDLSQIEFTIDATNISR